MSADNYLAIFHDPDGKYRAYMGFASDDRPDEELRKGRMTFCAETLEKAIEFAQEEFLEHGYHFVGGIRA